MRKSIMALEGIEEEEVVQSFEGDFSQDEINTSLSEITEASNNIEETQGIVDEATDIHETMGEMADALETPAEVIPSIEEDVAAAEPKEVSPETAEVVSIAVEHFCRRLGYKRKAMSTALESFGTSKAANGALISQIRIAQEALDSRISIAQEGILDSIKASIGMIFETEDKVLTKLNKASATYDAGTLKTEAIVDPGWSKYLKTSSTGNYTGKEALAGLAVIEKTCSNSEIKKNIVDLTECLSGLTKEVRGNWFVSNKNDIARIAEIQKTVTTNVTELKELTIKSATAKGSTFEPINAEDKAKLVSSIRKILEDKSLNKELKTYMDQHVKFALFTGVNANIRLKAIAGSVVGGVVAGGAGKVAGRVIGAFSAEDIKKATAAGRESISAIYAIKDIVESKIKVCSALVSYIEASV